LVARIVLSASIASFIAMRLVPHKPSTSAFSYCKSVCGQLSKFRALALVGVSLVATTAIIASTTLYAVVLTRPCMKSGNIQHAASGWIAQKTKRLNLIIPLPKSKPKTTATVLLGVLMMDTSTSVLTRKAIRIAISSDEIDLRFVICRPRPETMLEGDVVAIDMPENMNFGKTQRWFWYAMHHAPKNIQVVLKMDTDSIFCLSDLKATLHDSPKYALYGLPLNYTTCGKGASCPPKHCDSKYVFKQDCWYYMQGGLYGMSVGLLKELSGAELFRQPQDGRLHEDMTAGRWVNQTRVRESVTLKELRFLHSKNLIRVDPHTYSKYIEAYVTGFSKLNCSEQAQSLLAEKANISETPLRYLPLV
jgi:hypothetical protein